MGKLVFRLAIAVTIPVAMLVALRSGAAIAQQGAADGALDVSGPITYFIDEGGPRSGFRAGDRQLAAWALEAWQRNSAKGFRIEAAAEPAALVRLDRAEAREGQYGEMRPLTLGTKRGAAVFIHPDMESLGPDIAGVAQRDDLLRDTIVYLTCLHELGHALGLQHTDDFRDIMYSFVYGGDIVEYFGRYRSQLRARGDIASHSGLSALDGERLRALYPVIVRAR